MSRIETELLRSLVVVSAALFGSNCANGRSSTDESVRPKSVSQSLAPRCGASGLNLTWAGCQATYGVVAGNTLHVSDFGADSNANTDDADALQTAICCGLLMAAPTGGNTTRSVVDFGSGTYQLGRALQLDPGITLLGHGATLRLTGAATAAFTAEYTGTGDSLPLNVYGFDIDGALGTAASETGIALNGTNGAGRLVIALRGLTFHDLAGRAIAIDSNVAGRVAGVRTEAVLGALRVQGSNIELQVSDLISKGSTANPQFVADLDLTSASGTFLFREVRLSASVRIELSAGAKSTFIASDLQAPKGPLRLAAPNADVRIVDSLFGSPNDGVEGILNPQHVTFTRTTFVGSKTTSNARLVEIVFYEEQSGDTLVFDDCIFKWDPAVTPDDPVGIYVTGYNPDPVAARNRLIVRGTRFEGSVFSHGIRMNGGWLTAQSTTFDGPATGKGISLGGAGSRKAIAEIDGARFAPGLGCAISAENTQPELSLSNLEIPATQADAPCSIGATAIAKGRRVLVGAAAPTAFTGCLKGDIYRLSTPPACGTYEWVCQTQGLNNVTWTPFTELAACP